jgi:hypothetical protein
MQACLNKNLIMKKIFIILSFLLLVCSFQIKAQGLLDSLDNLVSQPKHTEYSESTFKAPRLINGQSVELIGKNELAAIISHRFGTVSEGSYNFYGLTESKIRLGLDYGLTKRINLGIGLGSVQHTFDGFLKIKILRQSKGERNIPVTVVFSSTTYRSGDRWTYPNRNNLRSSRYSYSHQLLIARKFSSKFSLQLTPGIVHRNLVKRDIDQNNVYSVAMGGRYKIAKHLAINAEYYYLIPGQTAKNFNNTLSLGLDIETGGHVFQLLLTNGLSPQEKIFIAETTNKWSKKEVSFGFNIIRVFNLKRKKKD